MIKTSYSNIAVEGIACCMPDWEDDLSAYYKVFTQETVDNFKKSTGVLRRYKAASEQTASDLAFVAAKRLIDEKHVDKESIGALLFVTECPDYKSPATSFVLQKRLGLPIDCIVYDINLGCSGFIYGMNAMASLMASSNVERGLLLFGDTMTKYVAPEDKSACMLFGDAGGAALLEKHPGATQMRFALRSDGYNYKSVIVSGGAFRNPAATTTRSLWHDGIMRSDYDFYMDGGNVFSFSTFEAPNLIKEYLEDAGEVVDTYDALLLHQANRFIIQRIAKRLKIPMEKVPVAIEAYGNTSGASIPVAAVYAYGDDCRGEDKRLLLCGFGVGLSWGVGEIQINTANVLPMLFTKDYYKEGLVAHT